MIWRTNTKLQIIVNFARQLPGFQAKFMLSCARQAGFHNKAYFSNYFFIHLSSYSTIYKRKTPSSVGVLPVQPCA